MPSFYVGPYARCLNPSGPSTQQARTCPKTDCSTHSLKHRLGKFCAKCGSEIQTVAVATTSPRVVWGDVAPELEDLHVEATFNGVDTYAENGDVTLELTVGNVEELQDEKPITAEVIAAEMEEFEAAFEDDIVVLRKHYGRDMVQIRWGVLASSS